MKTTHIFIFIIATLALCWLLGLGLFSTYALTTQVQSPTVKSQAIVVLTGGQNRIESGLKLFAESGAPRLFITGVHKGVRFRDILRKHNNSTPLPDCCISLGYQARSTVENAIEAKDWITENNIETIRLVTGNYHMPRAAMEFSHALPDIQIYKHPVEQQDLKENRELLLHLLISEFHKSIYRFVLLTLGIKGY